MAKVRKREGKNGISWQIDYFDPDGKRIRKSFKKKKDAEAELGKRVSLIAEGRYLDVKKECTTTLKELADKYTENFEDQAAFKAKEHYINNFYNFFGEHTNLANIRYVDLETYRNKLKQKLTPHEKVRKPASVNSEMSCMRHMLTKAVEWEMIENNPFHKGNSLLLKENNKRLRFLSEDEIDQLLEECPDHLRNVVECAINTGMRKKELLTLTWEQVKHGLIYLRLTKTNESRQIPINDDLKALFKRIRRKRQLTSKYVFTTADNKRLIDITRAFRGAVSRAGIEDFHFHDLRHTFASHFVMRGGSLKELQEILGHKDVSMTMRYAHLTQAQKKKAVNLLNGLTTSSKSVTNDCHKSVTSENLQVSNISEG